MNGESNSGSVIPGRIEAAENRPLSHVEDVWSNTTKLNASPMATPPMALISVPSVIMVKFLVHSVCSITTPHFNEILSDFSDRKNTLLMGKSSHKTGC
jgi:hypothetical protein